MRNFKNEKQYLCGIGLAYTDRIVTYSVGIYKGGYFHFKGAYEGSDLAYKKPYFGNATAVLSAKIINP